MNSRLCKASQLRKQLIRLSGSRHLDRIRRWAQLVEECHTIIPGGLPEDVRWTCTRLANETPPGGWLAMQKSMNNFIGKRLSRLVVTEATGRLFRKIAEAVHKRAEMMNGNLGGMV
ncbi:hypothetical protein GGI09_001755 [Coemansia sp. S100]|nr:hypothetical protein GGI09_001755 [Coemansia sp. S100]KAJ2108595.1 hypothetical protein GGI16_001069 [Coemansia sp. S142-1]